MNPLLAQFLSEARDFLQGIGEKLMLLEDAPADKDLINELFRLVHTLKGNTGLFEFPEMTRVLHAGEDLMDAIRDGRVVYSRELADRLLDAMDFVGLLCDEITATGALGSSQTGDSARLADGLRLLIPAPSETSALLGSATLPVALPAVAEADHRWTVGAIPESARMEGYRQGGGETVFLLTYTPGEGCFYQGDDPFFQARQTPDLLWGGIFTREPWVSLKELDAYRCILDFRVLTTATRLELVEHYRYVLDQVEMIEVSPLALVLPQGDPNGGPVYEDFVTDALAYLEAGRLPEFEKATRALMELSNPDLWLSSALRWLLLVLEHQPGNLVVLRAIVKSLQTLSPPDWAGAAIPEDKPAPPPPAPGPSHLYSRQEECVHEIITVQRAILKLADGAPWQKGRIHAAAATLSACLRAIDELDAPEELDSALALSLAANSGAELISWLDGLHSVAAMPSVVRQLTEELPLPEDAGGDVLVAGSVPTAEGEIKFNRRAEDAIGGPKSLKVDQVKIDRLMNLIGEMVVSKNALPYLAGRAETVFGVRELSREIRTQYTVINRIAEEMQDAIMQVCMMPVSFVFQRFPRLVRDTSRKLGKEVNLVFVGEDTEADKNIIEALGDPLVHIVRNSLDHGIETPEVRSAAGKPVAGTLTIRASQESDRVMIEIQDDGKGIDPLAIKRKAYDMGLIDEPTLDRISDQDAVNLVFLPGLSTNEVVSDLSGRGVGMDVVRSTVEKVNGSISLASELGKGTRICLSLPLSMAVTKVMIIESDGQFFGVPMDSVVETVRVPRARIRTIKRSEATVLRGRIVALKSINTLLGIAASPKANADDESAVLVVRAGEESVGLLVDQFHETADVILKPMIGVLAGLSAFSGSALMGDGSVLMVLNLKGVL